MKFLLTSGGVTNPSIRAALVDLLGKPIEEADALCIPTAAYAMHVFGGPHAYRFITGRGPSPLVDLGWKSVGVLELTALPSADPGLWRAAVRETDAILVYGGDSLYLCHWMRQSGLADLLPTLGNTVYAGISAGSMVVTPTFGTAYDDWFCREPPDPGTGVPVADARALGLVPFSIFPHVDTPRSEQNSMANAEIWAGMYRTPTYAIDDESAVTVVDDTVEVVSEGHWRLVTPEG